MKPMTLALAAALILFSAAATLAPTPPAAPVEHRGAEAATLPAEPSERVSAPLLSLEEPASEREPEPAREGRGGRACSGTTVDVGGRGNCESGKP